ncbi:hypothetical protein [Streptomyces sp. ME18-1-4]|uniref:hypothetical protein n=1 Tax=Streptomyces sp. ME18-1-4 TaxID=3028685 RepID=UPI0029A4FEBE|nr:hypothetical protein [Streptomyces sp. ME18-1-4]MDX3245869.1 hypothetical protein [Streptomyces sp. ME18-1-4]
MPAIRLAITVEYDEEDDLAPISAAILDRDETCRSVRIVAALTAGDPVKLLRTSAKPLAVLGASSTATSGCAGSSTSTSRRRTVR